MLSVKCYKHFKYMLNAVINCSHTKMETIQIPSNIKFVFIKFRSLCDLLHIVRRLDREMFFTCLQMCVPVYKVW